MRPRTSFTQSHPDRQNFRAFWSLMSTQLVQATENNPCLTSSTIIALIAWAIHRQKNKHSALLATFREHSQRLRTSFPDTIIDSDLILIDRDKKVAIAFDPESKKICLMLGPKRSGRSSRLLVHSAMAAPVDRKQWQQPYWLKDVHFDFLRMTSKDR